MTKNATVSPSFKTPSVIETGGEPKYILHEKLTVVLEQLIYVLHFSMLAVTVSPPPIPRNGEQIHTVFW